MKKAPVRKDRGLRLFDLTPSDARLEVLPSTSAQKSSLNFLRVFRRAVSTTLMMVVMVSCGDADSPAHRDSSTPHNLAGEVTVFAAASLTEVFTEVGQAFESENRGAKVRFSFAASSALVEQVKSGAPADVVATADEATMDRVGQDVRKPRVFARNSLAIVVRPGNPLRIERLQDLADPDVTLVLCAIEVPCGSLSAKAFGKANVSPSPSSLEANVKAVVSKVALGEADAGVVYVTDAEAASSAVDEVEIPIRHNVVTEYPIAAVRESEQERLARAFVSFVLSDKGQRILRRAGFAAP